MGLSFGSSLKNYSLYYTIYAQPEKDSITFEISLINLYKSREQEFDKFVNRNVFGVVEKINYLSIPTNSSVYGQVSNSNFLCSGLYPIIILSFSLVIRFFIKKIKK
uniref:Uncharacterized protein n=1 Tax=Avrainvillea mazei TaxID=381412 RepID=A0A1X9RPX4_9CHLO|nr:hypothetical protein [Avrainvillea mazei]